MPEGAVPRALSYVLIVFILCLASTFAWWAAANVARTEYRRLMSALACSMRIFFYSICLLCILVALKSIHLAPDDPRSTLFSWIHIGGTIWICVPSAWRAFHDRGPRLVVLLAVGWALCAVAGWGLWHLSPAFRWTISNLPRFLTAA
jgi:hypothetical protein